MNRCVLDAKVHRSQPLPRPCVYGRILNENPSGKQRASSKGGEKSTEKKRGELGISRVFGGPPGGIAAMAFQRASPSLHLLFFFLLLFVVSDLLVAMAADDISHDDAEAPKSPACNNKFQLVSGCN